MRPDRDLQEPPWWLNALLLVLISASLATAAVLYMSLRAAPTGGLPGSRAKPVLPAVSPP